MSITHRIYNVVRPWLRKAGILNLARRLVSDDQRAQMAEKIGLAGFTPPIEPVRARRYTGPVRVDGIQYITDMRANIGLGVSARMVYRSLVAWSAQTGLPVMYGEVETPAVNRNSDGTGDNTSTALPADEAARHDVSLIHLIPPEMRFAVDRYRDVLATTYNIGFWLWEVPKLPESWADTFDLLDEIWTPSTYTRDILQQITDLPVVYMPIPIEIQTSGQPASETRAKFGLPTDRFIFFFTFNPTSSMARKNPYGLIEAYRRAFSAAPAAERPLLVIKTHHLDEPINAAVAPGLRTAAAAAGVMLLDKDLSRVEMNDLLNACDCYVSLHRAEGFGLGIAESMALGKPVIATAYSANTDFMTAANSYGVGYTLRPITLEDHRDQPILQSVYVPGEGQVWAEPDIDQAAALMRHIVEHPQEAQQRGAIARRDIAEQWSVQAIADQIAARLNEIEASRKR